VGIPNRTYVVRIWHEPCASGDVWRASATDVRTQEKHYFKNQEELNRFLEEAEKQHSEIAEKSS
jgi:hypothetical protein